MFNRSKYPPFEGFLNLSSLPMALNALLLTKHTNKYFNFYGVIYIPIGSKDTKTGRSKD